MQLADIAIADIVPHAPPMVLLERIVSFDAASLVAEVTIRPESRFCDGAAVPAWVGLEYMAQAVAAHAGLAARLRGEPPLVGYLLGTRSYVSNVAQFAVGTTLEVHSEDLYTEGGLGAFACRIVAAGIQVRATIKVYQPPGDGLEDIDSGRIS